MDDEVWVLGFNNSEKIYYYKGSSLKYDPFMGMCDNIIEATKFDTYTEAIELGEKHDLIAMPITKADYAKELLINGR